MAHPRRRSKNRGKKSEASKTTKLSQQTTRICEFPNDILVSILACLPLKEAGMTSILSKRWRHVWEYIPTLNFDGSDVAYNLVNGRLTIEQKEIEVHRYIRWVDQVVSSHKAPTLDEFRVMFDFNTCRDLGVKTETNIDCWTRFAMEKRVKRLTMNLSECSDNYQPGSCYTFPNLFCNSLTYLQLESFHITGEVIESLLCNCLALEYLSVTFSETLEVLRVSGPSLSLKYLKIFVCTNLERLEISAPNLVSFYYSGPHIPVQFQSLPKLVEVCFSGHYAMRTDCGFRDLGCHVLQIEELKLIQPNIIFTSSILLPEYSVFKRLKKLDVEVIFTGVAPGHDLFNLIPLIKACPFLHHLKLQICRLESVKKRRMKKRKPCPHYNIKIVEIVGFFGYAEDLEFVRYLIKSAVSLDTVILDTRNMYSVNDPRVWELNPVHTRRRAREQAELLVRPVLKPGTDLVII